MGFTEVIKIKDYIKDKSKRKPGKETTIARMSGEELDEAELFIFRQLQMEKYSKAFKNLQHEVPIHPKEKIAHLGGPGSPRQINQDQWTSFSRTEKNWAPFFTAS